MRTRIVMLASVTIAASLGLAGCGASNSDPESGQSGNNQREGSAGEFTYWSMWQEGEPQQQVLASAIDKFESETGIKVNVQWSGREVLTQLIPRLTAGNPPDMVDNGSIDFTMRVGLENLQSTDDVYAMNIPHEDQLVSDVIPEAFLKSMQNENGETFLVPYEVISTTLWFNGKQTPGVAEDPPKTWEEFVQILDKLKKDGRTPLALDGDIADYAAYWLESNLIRAGGAGAVVSSAQDPTGKRFFEKDWVDASENIEKLVAGGYFPEGFNGTKFPTQQASWADQSTATDFILMGSWLPAEATASLTQSGLDPTSIEFHSIPFPAVGDNLGEGIVQAQAVGFAFPNGAKNADLAKQFAAWFMQKDQIELISTQALNMTPRTDVATPPELADFAQEYAQAKGIVPISDGVGAEEPQWVTDIWQPSISQFFRGELTAEEFRNSLSEKTVAYHANK